MLRRRIAVILSVFASLILLLSVTSISAQDDANDALTATELLAEVNAWRLNEGIAPLQINTTLEQMALAQATFLRSQLAAKADIHDWHVDGEGRGAFQRAYEIYGWKTYGSPERILIGENAAVGSISSAIHYWQGSEIHTRAALNSSFREAGVAALPIEANGDEVIVIVFGSRPDVLTAQLNPEGNLIYLTRETSRYSTEPINNPIVVRVFDGNGEALTTSQPWDVTIPLSETPSEELYVLSTEGDEQTFTRIDVEEDIAVIPKTVQQVISAEQLAPVLEPVTESVVEVASPATLESEVKIETPASTSVPVQAAPPQIANPDLLITYDINALIITSVSGNRLNLSGLSLRGNVAGVLEIQKWLNTATFPVDAFPPTNCLVLQNPNGSPYSQPSECSAMRSLMQGSSDRVFWMMEGFKVEMNGQIMGECPATAGRCFVKVT